MARLAHLPLSARLAAWYAATLLLLLSAFAVFSFVAYRAALRHSFDRHLAHEWSTVAPLVRVTADGVDTRALALAPPVATRLDGESATYVRLLDPAGRTLYASPNVRGQAPRPADLPADGAARHVAATWDGQPARSFLAPLRAPGGALVGWAEVTGVEWARRDELRDLARVLVLGVLLSVLVALAAGWALARRALRPVAVLTDAAARMAAAGPGAAPGARLPTAFEVRDELTRLAETVNGLLDRLERASARERRFTADAAHELLTPLATLRSEAEVALRRERDGAAYRDVLARVVGEVERMTATVRALLSLARAEAVDRTPGAPLDLTALVAERVGRHRAGAEAGGLALASDLAPGVRVAAAEAPLAEVIDNLLANALKYTPPGGRVEVRLAHEDGAGRCAGAARLVVADTGVGFDEATGARLFERFFRADVPAVQAQPGSGLGLAIVRAVVEGLGGSVHAASDGPGRGATVTVALPCLGPDVPSARS